MPEFTEEQQIAITEVLGITRDSLTSHLVYLGSQVTQAVIDRIVVHLGAWDAGIGSDFIEVEPNNANLGARIRPGQAREQIQNAIANLLNIASWGGSSTEVYLERG